jgi:Rrf2 family protein
MFSQTAEYALRAVVWLASHDSGVHSTPTIAAATRVPRGYLSKVVQALTRAGIVASHAGRRGGIRLARPARELSVFDVIQAVDPISRIGSCPLGIETHDVQLCPLHRRLDDAIAAVGSALAATTIADLLAEAPASRPFCREREG